MDSIPLMKLPIAALEKDDRVTPRTKLDEPTVKRYLELRRKGRKLPPPDVFFDAKQRWVADGLHRIEAEKRTGAKEIVCRMRKGSLADAVWFAASANDQHGLPLKPIDRKNAARLILLAQDGESSLSDSAIAEQCGLTGSQVAYVRRRLEASGKVKRRASRDVETTDGKNYTMDVSSMQTGESKSTGRPPKAVAAAKAKRKLTSPQGAEVPGWLRSVAEDSLRIEFFQTEATKLLERITEFADRPAGREVDTKTCAALVNELRKVLGTASFFAPCPACVERGQADGGCKPCKGSGWMTRGEFAKQR